MMLLLTDPNKIVDGDIESIHCLIWSIILHFSLNLVDFENYEKISLDFSFKAAKQR